MRAPHFITPLFIILSAACGGSPPCSPWEGDYSGTWTESTGHATTFEGSVSSSGALRWDLADGRQLSGNLPKSGEATFVIRHPRETLHGRPFEGALTYQQSGRTVAIEFKK